MSQHRAIVFVVAYEQLYFSVRDHLAATGWIARAIDGNATERTEDEGRFLRLNGYAGGYAVLAVLLKAPSPAQLPALLRDPLILTTRSGRMMIRAALARALAAHDLNDRALDELHRIHRTVSRFEQTEKTKQQADALLALLNSGIVRSGATPSADSPSGFVADQHPSGSSVAVLQPDDAEHAA